jgi:hypothetical protein
MLLFVTDAAAVARIPAADNVLESRQTELQAEGRRLLDELGVERVLAEVGTVRYAGSFVSGLMSWPDLDVMVLSHPGFTPTDVLALQPRIIAKPGVIGFDYRDERGARSPTGEARDERYHLPTFVQRGTRLWRLDLTIWLRDDHTNVTMWHEQLRDTITAEQRSAVLRIKDVWHRRPEYPDLVSGMEIYTAVLEHGVRTPQQFEAWWSTQLPGSAPGP